MNMMTRIPQNAALAFTGRQLDTIKRTVASDCNDEEFNLFIEYARVKGLDPFSKQVIPLVFSKNEAAKRKMSIVTTQDGQRVLASRCGDYRPAETEPEWEINDTLKGPANPLGIVKCTTTLWKQDKGGAWHKVVGWAYWDEYAPLREEADEYEMVETGQKWADTGRPKMRRQKKAGAAVRQVLDPSGNWARMPRVMIAKCATMQALRAGWPDTFSGVYAEEEFDKAKAQDLSASELLEQEREQQRLKLVAAVEDEYPFVTDDGQLIFLPAAKLGDHVLNLAWGYTSPKQLEAMQSRNREGWNRFWAHHKRDALEIKAELEKIAAKLAQPATVET